MLIQETETVLREVDVLFAADDLVLTNLTGHRVWSSPWALNKTKIKMRGRDSEAHIRHVRRVDVVARG